MKFYNVIIATGLIAALTACTTQYQGVGYDDVYYSPKNKPVEPSTVAVKPPANDNNNYANQPVQEQQQDQQFVQETEPIAEENYVDTNYYAPSEAQSPDGNTYINNNYYNDDYYDYAYSARLRRFYSPFAFNYYSDYFTNSYWYDYNPWNWGVSIYMGYNFWHPFSWRFNFGYPSYGWGYNPWYYDYNPYYGFGWNDFGYSYGGYGGYYPGYWNGFYDGYWYNHLSDYYYNSYDRNSNFYGHRGSVGSSGSLARGSNSTFGDRYEARLASDRSNPSANIRRSDAGNVVPAPRTGNTSEMRRGGTDENNTGYARGSSVAPASRGNTTDNTNGAVSPRSSSVQPSTGRNSEALPQRDVQVSTPGNVTPRQQDAQSPANRTSTQPQRQYQYAAPANRGQVQENMRNTQPYTSPTYNRPRSSQEYTSPKYRTQPSEYNQSPNPAYQQPSRNDAQRYATPDNSRNYQNAAPREQSAPARQNNMYQAPRNNTYQAPQRNSSPAPSRQIERSEPSRNTYSAPSRSFENSSPSRSTYSAPSRSSESSSPSRSSSSSSSSGSSERGHR